jgi:hypothetical protein
VRVGRTLLVALAATVATAVASPNVGLAAAGAGSASTGSVVRHCVVWIAPINNKGVSRVSPLECFWSLARAERYEHGQAPTGFVTLGPNAGLVPQASTTISVDYDAANFTGSTLTWSVGNSSGCNGGFSYSAASMPSGWNDRVSSSHSRNGCASNDHFHNVNFLGDVLTCTCATMGDMNNQTSSETWTQ